MLDGFLLNSKSFILVYPAFKSINVPRVEAFIQGGLLFEGIYVVTQLASHSGMPVCVVQNYDWANLTNGSIN